jgi:ferredoxin
VSRLHVDWTRCDGHGLCAELLPEMLDRDEWGFPVSKGSLEVTDDVLKHARHAVVACPLLALQIRA